jgi:hypothetical protein
LRDPILSVWAFDCAAESGKEKAEREKEKLPRSASDYRLLDRRHEFLSFVNFFVV